MQSNIVRLIGRLGSDPEFSDRARLAKFSVATQKKVEGEDQPRTTWHDVVAWGIHADSIKAAQLKKGDRVIIFGEIVQNKYEDREGKTRQRTEVHVVGLNGDIAISLSSLAGKNNQSRKREDSVSKMYPRYDLMAEQRDSIDDEVPF